MTDDAPELRWHREGQAALVAALSGLGLEARRDVAGTTPNGTKWRADVLFAVRERSIAVQLQRGYQPLREFRRRQARFAECGVECFWLFRREPYDALLANLAHARGARALPELPVALLEELHVEVSSTRVSMAQWLAALVEGSFRFSDGAWRVR